MLDAVLTNSKMTKILWWLLTIQYLFIFLGPCITVCVFYGVSLFDSASTIRRNLSQSVSNSTTEFKRMRIWSLKYL
jgi:hypothetical protein